MSTVDVRLRVSVGDGYLARREAATLLVTSAGLPLVNVFMEAVAGAELDAVTEHAESTGFASGAFVVLSWGERWRVAIFGDVEVESDLGVMTKLSAAGSTTWIERQLRERELTIGVGIATVDDQTDLAAGIVRSGGFSLSLSPSGSASGSIEHPSTTNPIRDTLARPLAGNRAIVANDAYAESTQAIQRPPLLDFDTLLEQTANRTDDTIFVPDELLDRLETQDSTQYGWQLRFLDGPTERVDTPLLIGRAPTQPNGEQPARLLSVVCPLVSSTHVRVNVDSDNRLVLTDLDSSNGTWVVRPGQREPVRLEAHHGVIVEPGTPVQVGSRVFIVEHRAPTDH